MVRAFCIGRNNVDIFLDDGMVYPGGNCSNVAANLAKAGHTAALLTTVGDDEWGNLQLEPLEALGVDTSFSHKEHDRTAWCMINHENNNRIFVKSDISIFHRHPITLSDIGKISQEKYDIIYTCSDSIFSEGVFEAMSKTGLPVCCDFTARWNLDDVLRAAPYVNHAYLSCEAGETSEIKKMMRKIGNAGSEIVVVTRGMKGSLAWDGHTFYEQCAYDVPIVDTLGAGDSFLSAFVWHYFDGKAELDTWLKELPTCSEATKAFWNLHEKLMKYSLTAAAVYATKVCTEKGGFGCGIPYDVKMTEYQKTERECQI